MKPGSLVAILLVVSVAVVFFPIFVPVQDGKETTIDAPYLSCQILWVGPESERPNRMPVIIECKLTVDG